MPVEEVEEEGGEEEGEGGEDGCGGVGGEWCFAWEGYGFVRRSWQRCQLREHECRCGWLRPDGGVLC